MGLIQRLNRAWVFLFLLFSLFQPLRAFAYTFRPGEYEEIRELVAEILQKYPPSEYYYLGLGRSPTPVIAFLENLAPEIASQLPFSKLSFAEQLYKDGKFEDVPHVPEKMKRHFDRFVPTADRLKGRKVLLIDFVSTGDSLLIGGKFLKEYLSRHRPGTQSDVLGLLNTYRDPPRPLLLNQQLIFLRDRFQKLSDLFAMEAYKDFAEYGEFNIIFNDELSLTPREAYRRFRGDLKEKMKSDTKVEALRGGAPRFFIPCLVPSLKSQVLPR